MKISKLFHWLYAILMLLPFVFFVPSVLYYAFNDNATMQIVEVPKTETISVDFNQNVRNNIFDDNDYWNVHGGNYTFTVSDNTAYVSYSSPYTFSGLIQQVTYKLNHIYYAWAYVFQESGSNVLYSIGQPYAFGNDVVPSGVLTRIYYRWNVTDLNGLNYTAICIGNRSADSTVYTFEVSNVNLIDLTQMFGVGNEPSIAQFDAWFTNSYYPYTESKLMQITYDTVDTEELVSNTDIINYAWESIWDLPLFNWCKVSFVSVPFTYITGLFGLAASNSFNYVFTYFASMSIIWLVFDVIMYVPLLVHRWIDKGIVE